MESLIFFGVGLIILIIIAKILLLPLKRVVALIGNALVGGLTLIIFNFVGNFANLNIAINPINSILVGVLGVPGVVILLLFQLRGIEQPVRQMTSLILEMPKYIKYRLL